MGSVSDQKMSITNLQPTYYASSQSTTNNLTESQRMMLNLATDVGVECRLAHTISNVVGPFRKQARVVTIRFRPFNAAYTGCLSR